MSSSVVVVTNLVAVVTERGKNRITEALAGVISGALSPGGVNRAIVPVFFKIGHVGAGPPAPPDPTFTDIVNADGNAFQKNLTVADVAVVAPPSTVVGGGLTQYRDAAGELRSLVDPSDMPAKLVAETTLFVRIFVDVNEAVLPGPEVYQEVGVFFQFGANPPDMVVYGTYPNIAKAAGLTVDFTLKVKI